MHNFRSALDNLAYELAIDYTGDPLPPDVAEGSQFPIFGDVDRKGRTGQGPRMFQSGRSKQIGGIDPRAQADIEDLQPYKRGNNFASDPLWMLHKLSNFDKHRLPHLTLFQLVGTAHWFTDTFIPDSDIESNSGPLENGAIAIRYKPPGDPREKVDVNFRPLFSIGFGHDSPPVEGRWVLRVLREIGEHITDEVIPKLTHYLT